MAKVKFRARDIKRPVQEEPKKLTSEKQVPKSATKDDVAVLKDQIVRLEALVSNQKPTDLSPLEETMRSNLVEIAKLKETIGAISIEMPLVKYEFELSRDDDGRIQSVTANPIVQ